MELFFIGIGGRRSVYGHVITKFSTIGILLIHGASRDLESTAFRILGFFFLSFFFGNKTKKIQGSPI